MGPVAFLTAVAVWPGTASAVLMPRWTVLSVGLALLLYGARVRPTAAHVIMLALWLYAGLSLVWATVFVESLDGFWKLTVFGMAFLLGAAWRPGVTLYRAVACGVAVSACVAIGQRYGYSPVEQLAPPAGLFGNKNFMGEIAALALIPCFAYRWWALFPLVEIALVLSNCRSAWLAAICAALCWVWVQSRATALGLIAALMLAGGVLAVATPQKFDLPQRLAIWADTWEGVSFWGNGIGSLWTEFPRYATRIDTVTLRTEHAHNDALEQLFELGVPGLAGMVALFVLALLGADPVERAILVAGGVDSLFGFPLHEPATVLFLAFVAGRAAARRGSLFERVGARGVSLRERLGLAPYGEPALLRDRPGRPDFPAQSLSTPGTGLCGDHFFEPVAVLRGSA